MTLFDNVNSSEELVEFGDTSYSGLRESGLYKDTIEEIYMTEAKSGAIGVVLKLNDGKSTMKYTAYITSGNEKGKKTYYEKDGKKYALVGYELINSLAELITGKSILNQDTDKRSVMQYNRDAEKEIPTMVEALCDLWGKPVITGVIQQLESKNSFNESTGKYEPTADTRTVNEIDKFFHAETNQTITERKADAPASYIESWIKRNKDKIRDKVSKNAPKEGNGLSRNKSSSSSSASTSASTSNSNSA